jgi:hypothetical protein
VSTQSPALVLCNPTPALPNQLLRQVAVEMCLTCQGKDFKRRGVKKKRCQTKKGAKRRDVKRKKCQGKEMSGEKDITRKK